MKIGILTQPLHNNYGGLLQAYALQQVLKSMGHDPWIIRRVLGKKSFWSMSLSYIKYFILRYFLRKKELRSPFVKVEKLNKEELAIISTNTSKFINKYINPKTELIDNDKLLKTLTKHDFEAFIVGSDQVWRLDYSPNMPNFYLDFLGNRKDIKRISYAASFGVSHWHYPLWLTYIAKHYSKKFNAISVREKDGVKLCNEHLGVDAIHVVDPTMLLTKDKYIELTKEEAEPKSCGSLFVYLLDKTNEKEKLVDDFSFSQDLTPFTVMANKKISIKNRHDLQSGVFPSVTKWIKAFNDAKFVITDSFHGCVFSILFNVPFIAIGNEKRGMARFESLLNMFGLKDRLITNLDNFDIDSLENNNIDWNAVNLILEKEREKAVSFLNSNLQ